MSPIDGKSLRNSTLATFVSFFLFVKKYVCFPGLFNVAEYIKMLIFVALVIGGRICLCSWNNNNFLSISDISNIFPSNQIVMIDTRICQ